MYKIFRLLMSEITFNHANPLCRHRRHNGPRGRNRRDPRVRNKDRNSEEADEDEDEDEDKADDMNEDEEDHGDNDIPWPAIEQIEGELVGLDQNDQFIQDKETCEIIGRNMHVGRTTVPAVYGRPPRDIRKYSASFKAAE